MTSPKIYKNDGKSCKHGSKITAFFVTLADFAIMLVDFSLKLLKSCKYGTETTSIVEKSAIFTITFFAIILEDFHMMSLKEYLCLKITIVISYSSQLTND